MMRRIPVENGQYAGGALNWLRPFPVLTGLGLVLGNARAGASTETQVAAAGLRQPTRSSCPNFSSMISVAHSHTNRQPKYLCDLPKVADHGEIGKSP